MGNDIYKNTYAINAEDLRNWLVTNNVNDISLKVRNNGRLIFTFYYGRQRCVTIIDTNVSKNVIEALTKSLLQAKKDDYCAELRASNQATAYHQQHD